MRLEWGRCEALFTDFVLEGPSCQCRVLVVVEQRAMVPVAAALGGHANISDAGVLGAEIISEDVDVAHGFQRGLAGGRLAEYSTIRALTIQREARAVALPAQKLEFAVGRTLRDVWVQ